MIPNEILIGEIAKTAADLLGGEYSRTFDGVPRILFTTEKGDKISVVYLASTKQWKAFYPFKSDKQTRKYFESVKDLMTWLLSMGVKNDFIN